MTGRKIEIYIDSFDVLFLEKMFIDFFDMDKTSIYPIYVRSIGSKVLVVEASENEDVGYIPLARIYSKSYPSKRILFIEEIEGQKKNWKKVEDIARKIIEQMKMLDFGVGLIKPEGLFGESTMEEMKKFNIKAPIIIPAKVLPTSPKNSTKDELDSSLANNLVELLSKMEFNTAKKGKYGSDRDLSTSDVMQIVKRYIEYRKNTGGSHQKFYDALPSFIQSKFRCETFRKWVENKKFSPVEEPPTKKPTKKPTR